MRKSATKAPDRLSSEAKRLWKALVRDYGLDGDDAALAILGTALEALDRLRQAQARIEQDGPLLPDRFGQPKPHPLLAVERDARGQFLAGLKQLNLDLEPLQDRPGRPSGGRKLPMMVVG